MKVLEEVRRLLLKIIKALVRIKMGYQRQLVLGNLDSRRDWGHAKDYVVAMWKILTKKPGDYVIATGKQYSIRQFINLVAKNLILKLPEGKGLARLVTMFEQKKYYFSR